MEWCSEGKAGAVGGVAYLYIKQTAKRSVPTRPGCSLQLFPILFKANKKKLVCHNNPTACNNKEAFCTGIFILGNSCVAKRYAPDPAWKDMDHMLDRFDNPVFDVLYLDAERPNWRQRSMWWKRIVGSILVVGRDGKDLSVEEVEQLYRFGRDWVLPRVRQCTDGEGVLASRSAFLDQCTAKTFQRYSNRMEQG
jgi:hypothetical protein